MPDSREYELVKEHHTLNDESRCAHWKCAQPLGIPHYEIRKTSGDRKPILICQPCYEQRKTTTVPQHPMWYILAFEEDLPLQNKQEEPDAAHHR